MAFLAVPEEETALLAAAHRERPMKAVARLCGIEPETYQSVTLEESALMQISRHDSLARNPMVSIFLRDVVLAGDFVWRAHPDPRAERDLDFVRSLCVQMDVSVQVGSSLIAGSIGVARKGWYEDAGMDASLPRQLKTFMERKLRILCPYRAAPPWTISALESGEKTLKSVANMLAHVSAGAVRFREEGGHLLDPERGKLDWEYELIDPNRHK